MFIKKQLWALSIVLLFLSFTISCGETNSQNNKETETKVSQGKSFSLDENDFRLINLEFTGFKTEEKIGVPGTFDRIFVKAYKGATISEVMEGATFTIDPKSIETKNPERNENIINYFFGNIDAPFITGKFQSFTNEGYKIALKMNGVEKIYQIIEAPTSNQLVFDFSIDIVKDFSASEALNGLAKACEVLHNGKTWSDVTIKGSVKL